MMREVKPPTFGQVLRGYRLGFRYHRVFEAMIRISIDGPLIRVWMCPPDALPSRKLHPLLHVNWWEHGGGELLALSPAIIDHARPTRLVQFTVDDEGMAV